MQVDILIKKITNFKYIKYLIFLLLVFLYSCIFIFFLFGDNNEVAALSGDYSTRVTGGLLNPGDWNNLPLDFVKKDSAGDTMSGDLDMGANRISGLANSVSTNSSYAATVGFVNLVTSYGATDKNGSFQKLVCGSTVPGSTGWIDFPPNGIRVDVDTTDFSGSNFLYVKTYIISIKGDNIDYKTGANGIQLPSNSGFKLFLRTSIAAAEAEKRNWVINWCGAGN